MENKSMYEIKLVAEKTGLSPFLIRAWENRYNAVVPERTESNRRLYSGIQIEKLNLLHQAVKSGHSISCIAKLSNDELKKLVGGDTSSKLEEKNKILETDESSLSPLVTQAISAIRKLDHRELENILLDAVTNFSQPLFFKDLIIPLMHFIGKNWRNGNIRIAHEHMATEVIRNFLINLIKEYTAVENSPGVIVATPLGQKHEMGALMSGVIAATEGWNITYLGSDLPSQEIGYSAKYLNVKAIILSIIYPIDDLRINSELLKLKRILKDSVKIIVGGQGSVYYSSVINEIGALIANTPDELRNILENLRKEPAN